MTYHESAKGKTITRRRALQELRNHGVDDAEEFFNDLGAKAEYKAQAVLEWLGYWNAKDTDTQSAV